MSQPVLDPVACLKALVACPSVTPAEGGALHLLADILGTAGFRTDRTPFKSEAAGLRAGRTASEASGLTPTCAGRTSPST